MYVCMYVCIMYVCAVTVISSQLLLRSDFGDLIPQLKMEKLSEEIIQWLRGVLCACDVP